MPETRHIAGVRWHELTGPTYAELGHRETVDWHYHDAGLRLAELERVHRDLSARIRLHTREVLPVLSGDDDSVHQGLRPTPHHTADRYRASSSEALHPSARTTPGSSSSSPSKKRST